MARGSLCYGFGTACDGAVGKRTINKRTVKEMLTNWRWMDDIKPELSDLGVAQLNILWRAVQGITTVSRTFDSFSWKWSTSG